MYEELIYAIFLVLLTLVTILIKNSTIQGIAIGLITSILYSFIKFAVKNRNKLKLIIPSIINYNTDIRFSISYLFRIKIDDEYLLIKSNQIKSKFQPVGGVYKFYSEAKLDKYGMKPDNGIKPDKKNLNDLRVRIPGRNIFSFLNWYESRKDRETNVYREFYEELLEPNILPKEIFPYIMPKHIQQLRTKIRYSDFYKCKEMLIYEIFEIKFTEEQIQELKKLKKNTHKLIKWANEDEILSQGVVRKGNQEPIITEHSRRILEGQNND